MQTKGRGELLAEAGADMLHIPKRMLGTQGPSGVCQLEVRIWGPQMWDEATRSTDKAEEAPGLTLGALSEVMEVVTRAWGLASPLKPFSPRWGGGGQEQQGPGLPLALLRHWTATSWGR